MTFKSRRASNKVGIWTIEDQGLTEDCGLMEPDRTSLGTSIENLLVRRLIAGDNHKVVCVTFWGRAFKFQNWPIKRTHSIKSTMRPILKFEHPTPSLHDYAHRGGKNLSFFPFDDTVLVP